MTSMIHKKSFKWIITDFRSAHLVDKRLTSKTFTLLENRNKKVLSFKLDLEFEDNVIYTSKWIKFFLLCTCKTYNCYLSFRSTMSLSILDSSNQKSITMIKNYSGNNTHYECLIGSIEKKSLFDSLVYEDLILFFEMEICFEPNEKNFPSYNYKSFITAEKFSDVTLHIGNKIIPAHKSILALKSPVFDAMFSSDMSEANSNKAKVVDIDYDVFLEVLRFMYTGKVEKLDELALEILKAAHFYQINDLIIICSNFLSLNLNFNNTFEVLNVAKNYGFKELTNTCLIFITLHFKTFENENLPGLIDVLRINNFYWEIMSGLDLDE